jgi:uncharacterized OB-fold protein
MSAPPGDAARADSAAVEAVPRLLPVEDDVDTAGFWEAARRGELVVRACESCGAFLHLPRAYCHECGSWEGRWAPVSGRGRLHSWTVVEHQVHPAYAVPYTVVLVDLDDAPGVRLVGHLAGSPHLTDGQEMRVRFESLPGGTVLPQWEPA